MLFLSFVCYIIFTFLTMFSSKFGIIANVSLIIALVCIPFTIIEAVKRKNEVQDGFKAPDYPSEVQNGSARIPNFEKYGYVDGLKYDDGVKKLMVEVYKDGLNLYHKNLKEMITVDYSDIVDVELLSDTEIKQSNAKSILYGATLGALGGLGAGLLGAAFGGIKAKDIYYLELKIKENDEVHSLYLSDDKTRLLKLARDIGYKVKLDE